jgi:hypothetical protein
VVAITAKALRSGNTRHDDCAVNGWTIGTDVGTMLTGLAVLPTATVWLWKQFRYWRASKNRRSGLRPGDSLRVGQSLYSRDGRTKFTLYPDANMVVEVEGYGVFDDTGTRGRGEAVRLTLEIDGRLVIHGADDSDLWHTEPGGEHLDVQNDAHVVLYGASSRDIWKTNWYLLRGQPVGPVVMVPYQSSGAQ